MAIINPLPYIFVNGTVADATQVDADFAQVVANVNANAAANGANADITSLSGLATPLSVPQGGTGRATFTSGNLLTGNGTGAINSIAQSTFLAAPTGPTAWTPTDASGAGLVLTVTAAFYYQVGKLVTLTMDITYPATVDGTTAAIGGLPATADVAVGALVFGGIFYTGATQCAEGLINGSNNINFAVLSSAALFTNTNATSARFRGTITYFTA